MTRIHVNGDERAITGPCDVRSVVAQCVPACADGRPDEPAGVAVALNDRVVPRGLWDTTLVAAGDRVEIVTAVQGG